MLQARYCQILEASCSSAMKTARPLVESGLNEETYAVPAAASRVAERNEYNA
jgi:hypothetical protein